MSSTFRKVVSVRLGFVGFAAGLFSGFIIRDEYYYPSFKKIEELFSAYYEKDSEIQSEIAELNARLNHIQELKKNSITNLKNVQKIKSKKELAKSEQPTVNKAELK